MSECFSIGSTVACTTCFKQNIEGEVLAFDPSTKMLILSILFNIEQNHQMVHATINSIRRWIDRHYGSQCMRFAVSFVCGENYLLAVCCNNTWIVVHRMTAWNGTHTQDVGYYYHAYHNCIYGKKQTNIVICFQFNRIEWNELDALTFPSILFQYFTTFSFFYFHANKWASP